MEIEELIERFTKVLNEKKMTQCVARFKKEGSTYKFLDIIEENTHYKNQRAMDAVYKNLLDFQDDIILAVAYHPGDTFDGKELYDIFGQRYNNIG